MLCKELPQKKILFPHDYLGSPITRERFSLITREAPDISLPKLSFLVVFLNRLDRYLVLLEHLDCADDRTGAGYGCGVRNTIL